MFFSAISSFSDYHGGQLNKQYLETRIEEGNACYNRVLKGVFARKSYQVACPGGVLRDSLVKNKTRKLEVPGSTFIGSTGSFMRLSFVTDDHSFKHGCFPI